MRKSAFLQRALLRAVLRSLPPVLVLVALSVGLFFVPRAIFEGGAGAFPVFLLEALGIVFLLAAAWVVFRAFTRLSRAASDVFESEVDIAEFDSQMETPLFCRGMYLYAASDWLLYDTMFNTVLVRAGRLLCINADWDDPAHTLPMFKRRKNQFIVLLTTDGRRYIIRLFSRRKRDTLTSALLRVYPGAASVAPASIEEFRKTLVAREAKKAARSTKGKTRK